MTLRRWRATYLVLATAAAVFVGGCGGGDGLPQFAAVESEELWAEVFSATPPRVIDVRGAADYERSHVPNSESMPGECAAAGQPVAARAGGDDIVIVGYTEFQARRAAANLLGPGETARVLAGGMTAWDCGLDLNDEQLKQWMDEARPVRLIDVRTPGEWSAAHIPGSVNRPLDQLDIWALTIAPSEEVVLICGIGARSATARNTLAGRGYTRVHNLLGGISAWDYDLDCG